MTSNKRWAFFVAPIILNSIQSHRVEINLKLMIFFLVRYSRFLSKEESIEKCERRHSLAPPVLNIPVANTRKSKIEFTTGYPDLPDLRKIH